MMCNTGRMTDIWASFYLQSCGFKSVYTEADVRHDRHIHNATKDFKDEILGNLNTLSLLEDLKNNPLTIQMHVPARTFQAFEEYKKIIGSIK
jgi:hypothetical protein